MKKILSGLLCICILLSGCSTTPPPQTHPTAPETTAPVTEPSVPLLDQGIAAGDTDGLLYIPNEAVEDMLCPEVRLFGNGLLLGSYIRDQYVLKHISLEDGRLLAEFRISAAPGIQVRIGSRCVGLLDGGTNRFLLLNEDLTLRSTQSVPTEGYNWYLSSGLDQMYCFHTDNGLLVRDLLTGEEQWILENAVFTHVIGAGTEYILFEYTDTRDQRTYERCLNLSTGTMETFPTSDSIITGTRRGQTWLLVKRGTPDSYILSDGVSTASFTWTDSSVTLLPQGRHLLMTDPSGRVLRLYDTRGRFLSTCSLPDAEYATVGTDLIWSGYWDGYFFTDTVEGTCRLMFWDISGAHPGEDLELLPLDQPQKVEPVLNAALYERAEKLSEQFGIQILIAEQCALEYSHYNTYPLTDPSFVTTALDVLEGCMEKYPEGFFRQLPYGTMDHIQIELVGGLTLKDSTANQPDSTAAFVQDQDGYICMVMDGFQLISPTVYHEFSHVIDRRLNWDAMLRDNALFSEDHWLSLQPEGFAYVMSYTDMPESVLHYANSGYFSSDYAMTYPTEDRATLFSDVMIQTRISPEMQEKMRYYARCIRDCFDTEGWPETTAWELMPD